MLPGAVQFKTNRYFNQTNLSLIWNPHIHYCLLPLQPLEQLRFDFLNKHFYLNIFKNHLQKKTWIYKKKVLLLFRHRIYLEINVILFINLYIYIYTILLFSKNELNWLKIILKTFIFLCLISMFLDHQIIILQQKPAENSALHHRNKFHFKVKEKMYFKL